jgi:hypothetical protein
MFKHYDGEDAAGAMAEGDVCGVWKTSNQVVSLPEVRILHVNSFNLPIIKFNIENRHWSLLFILLMSLWSSHLMGCGRNSHQSKS